MTSTDHLLRTRADRDLSDRQGALLRVRGLTVGFTDPRGGRTDAVRGVDFEVHQGRTLAVVGESGSGKSVSLLGLAGLLPQTASVGGEVLFDGRDLLG